MLLITVILTIVLSLGMILGMLTKNYLDAIEFLQALEVEFQYYVLFDPAHSEATKKAITTIFKQRKPRPFSLLWPKKNLHRNNYFSPNEIELFFTRKTQ